METRSQKVIARKFLYVWMQNALVLLVCSIATFAFSPVSAEEPQRHDAGAKTPPDTNSDAETPDLNAPDMRKRQAQTLTRLAVEQYARDGNAAVAQAGFEAALQLDPQYALPLFNLGALAERRQNWKEAEALYRRYLQKEKSAEGQKRAAPRLAEARRHLQTDENTAPAKPGNGANASQDAYLKQLAQALAAAQKGGTQEASALTAKTIQTAPQRWEGYMAQSGILLKQNRYPEAEQSLQEARKRAPLARSQALQEAIAACHAAGQAQEQCVSAARALQEGKPAEAAASYEQAARLLPANGNLAIAAAGARAAAGDYAQALRNLDAAGKSPDRAIVSRAVEMRQHLTELAAQTQKQSEKSPVPAAARLNQTLEQILAQADAREQDVSAAVTQAIQTSSAQADERAKLARELEQALAEAQAAGKAAAKSDADAKQRDDGTNSGKVAASVAQLEANKQRTRQKKALDRAVLLQDRARAYGYGEPGYTP